MLANNNTRQNVMRGATANGKISSVSVSNHPNVALCLPGMERAPIRHHPRHLQKRIMSKLTMPIIISVFAPMDYNLYMNGPIAIAGYHIDAERFPQIYWYAQQDPAGVEERLIGLFATLEPEAAFETLESDLTRE